jgi:hypothetical protein
MVLDRVLTDRKSEWAVGSEALIPICNTQITEMEIEQGKWKRKLNKKIEMEWKKCNINEK